jgi:hypothetical protein
MTHSESPLADTMSIVGTDGRQPMAMVLFNSHTLQLPRDHPHNHRIIPMALAMVDELRTR